MKENKNIILTYSALEQRKNGIKGVGRYLMNFLGIFPFIPILIALFSCYIVKISDADYERSLITIVLIEIIFLICFIVNFLKNMLIAFIIDENGDLYRIKISTFWYKLKDKMYLLNPTGMVAGRLIRFFYMINNIKGVFQNVVADVTFDELISMGKMERISNIKNVKIFRKKVEFTAVIEEKKHKKETKVKFVRVFEKDECLCEYLNVYEKFGKIKAAKIDFSKKTNPDDIFKIDVSPKGHLKKLARFTVVWICLVAWAAAFTISGDLNKLSKINSGEYILTIDENDKEVYISIGDDTDYFYKEDYGKMYKPIIVIFISVESVYGIMKISDFIIQKVKSS